MNQEDPKNDDVIVPDAVITPRVETIHPYNSENLRTLKGRMNRLDFIILWLSLSLLTAILFKYLGINPISMSAQIMLDPEASPDGFQTTLRLGTLSLFLFTLLSVKRFHDIDYSGWVAAVFIIPIAIGGLLAGMAIFVGLILRLILIFAPGVPKANRFGEHAAGNNRNKIVLLIGLAIFLFFIYSGLMAEANPYLEELREYMINQQT